MHNGSKRATQCSKRNRHLTANARFYKNEMESYPDGDFIENILTKWKGDYDRLEKHHGYIQWLFPTRGAGVNSYAQELKSHEVEAIMDDPDAFDRVLRSYEMMLDFYGMELSDKTTGEIRRAANWKVRFQHLNGSYHNYLRITRMLVFLEEFGYEHYKRPFVEFVLQEAMEHGTLIQTLESCKRFWIESIRIEEDRQHLKDYVHRMETSYASLNQNHNAELFGRADDMVKKSKDCSKENDHESLGNPEKMSKAEWREKIKTLKLLEEDFSSHRQTELDQYRQGYPGKEDDENMRENAQFYKNELKFYPDGDLIETILTKYKGDYARLEKQHDYMQWLFPLREFGMNFTAKIHLLQRHEIKAIMDDPEASGRVLRSYEMMLDFYGMELSDKTTGEIRRAENWRDRFHHLNRSYHNYLRITRILKFLGEFGYEHYKRPFVEFVLQEAIKKETLPNTLESCVLYWLETIKSAQDRKQLRDNVRKLVTRYLSDESVVPSEKDDNVDISNGNQTGHRRPEETEDKAEDSLDVRANDEWREKVKKFS
ncbi:uncharacterized protein LOC111125887 isoform X5 [Crassostrea virginica]